MKTLGQVGYESYCLSTGWKSLISGNNLPQWEKVQENVKAAWEVAAKSVVEYLAQETQNEINRQNTGEYLLKDVVKCPLSPTKQARIVGIDPCPNPNHGPWEYLLRDLEGNTYKVMKEQLDKWQIN